MTLFFPAVSQVSKTSAIIISENAHGPLGGGEAQCCPESPDSCLCFVSDLCQHVTWYSGALVSRVELMLVYCTQQPLVWCDSHCGLHVSSFCSRYTAMFAVFPETGPAHVQPILPLCTYSIVCCHKTISVRVREGREDGTDRGQRKAMFLTPHHMGFVLNILLFSS